jgi:hypothetical protein
MRNLFPTSAAIVAEWRGGGSSLAVQRGLSLSSVDALGQRASTV